MAQLGKRFFYEYIRSAVDGLVVRFGGDCVFGASSLPVSFTGLIFSALLNSLSLLLLLLLSSQV